MVSVKTEYDLLRQIGRRDDRIEELEAKIKQLHTASERMRSDLLIRGETEANGTRVVNVSSSVWTLFCDALDNARL